jgi:hypothetical protein
MCRLIKYFSFVTLLLFGIQGCESDPILSPNAVDETEKGSYGLSSLPNNPESESDDQENPELF